MTQQTLPSVHKILANSYIVFLLAVIVGSILKGFWEPFALPAYAVYIGTLFSFIGALCILWAQRTSRVSLPIQGADTSRVASMDFKKGPYRFSRTPTHMGLGLLVLGYGLLEQSAVIVLLGVITFIITKLTFIRKEESVLEQKYGDAYRAYKKDVCL